MTACQGKCGSMITTAVQHSYSYLLLTTYISHTFKQQFNIQFVHTLDTNLRQLENVLLPVNNFETAILEPSSNVPGVKPAVFVNGLSRLVWVL